MTVNEIKAMTNLLDDPDVNIYSHIEKRLVDIGQPAVPELETAWNESSNMLVQSRIENIIDRISFNQISDEFKLWNNLVHPDLLDALIILNKVKYPLIDCSEYYQKIEEKTREIWLEFNEHLTSFELVNVLNKMMFEFWRYGSVHDSDEDAFKNMFFSNLMEKNMGDQFSIASLYLIFADRLKLPIYPVLLEDQLILAYVSANKFPEDATREDVLFYINPNEGGIVFDENSIKRWALKHDLTLKDEYFLPVNNKKLIYAYMSRLIHGFETLEDSRKVRFLSSLLKMSENNS